MSRPPKKKARRRRAPTKAELAAEAARRRAVLAAHGVRITADTRAVVVRAVRDGLGEGLRQWSAAGRPQEDDLEALRTFQDRAIMQSLDAVVCWKPDAGEVPALQVEAGSLVEALLAAMQRLQVAPDRSLHGPGLYRGH